MWRYARTIALALAVVVGTTACFGSFNLTRKVYDWNNGPDDKWVKEGYFLVTGVLLPIYGFATLADALVFNSIEFWSGENPVELSRADDGNGALVGRAEVGAEEVSVRLMTDAELPYLSVTHSSEGRVERVLRVVREGSETRITDGDGERLLTAVHRSDGGILIRGEGGKTLALLHGNDLEGLVRRVVKGTALPSGFAARLSGSGEVVAP